ncbi:endo-1,4-beta-xylanase [Metabacillus malikii]|uniref:Beta-xylanase n=1 Tax=Metabacillus malikii TaxID=1504265 RepID=A0ABT9ZNN8_9BACI|nr:endo-1,4-beta-xylanase [Metabacillus malikii]MDQ0233524.1 endo-1,4-beta-xylanase [Metabacillus malikii]
MSRMLKRFVSLLLVASLVIPFNWITPTAKAAANDDIPVLLYHRIVDNPSNEWTDTNTETFKETMKYLQDNNYTALSAEQYVNIMEGKEQAPENPILLTFDDATPDFITTALPILKQYDMNAVLFVISGWVGGDYSMSKEQLETLVDEPNVSLQNHSKTHGEGVWGNGVGGNSEITEENAQQEISTASEFLKELTGQAPVLMAYPYGSYNDITKQVNEENGIKYAFKVGYPNDEGNYGMGRHYITEQSVAEIAEMIGGPAPEETPDAPPADENEISSYDFEDSVQGWEGRGTAKVELTEDAYEGTKALKATGRTENWHGPSINVSELMEKGAKYEVSGYVKLVDGQEATEVKLSANQPGGGNEYPTIEGPKNVTDAEWVQFKGEYTYDLSASEVSLYFEATNGTTEFIIDNVKVVQTASAPDFGDDDSLDQSGVKSDFEDGTTQNWGPRNPGIGYDTVVTDEAAKSGTKSLLTNANNQYEGPLLNVVEKMHPGHIYDLSVWVKLQEGQPDTVIRMSVQSGETTFTNLSPNVTVTDQEWVELKGQFTVSNVTDILNAYVELADKPDSPIFFYIDDFTLTHVGKVAPKPPVQLDLEPISEVYKNDFLIGNAIDISDLSGDSLELLKHHHTVVTAENAMKPEYAYNASGEFDFASEDELVAKVKSEGLDLVGHVLVWHQQSREALHTDANGNPLSREEALENLREHVKTTVEHFGDDVISWDVVNEAMNDNPPNPADWKGSLRNSGWLKAIGPDYIEQAYLAAHEVLVENGWEDVKLYYNDYNDDNQNKAEAIKNMIKEINDKYRDEIGGNLIDGMGMQSHYHLSNTDPENVRKSLEKFKSIGVEISVTELDVTAGSNRTLTEKEEKDQAYLYAQLFKLYKEYKEDIARVTFWGVHDGRSWRGEQSPLIFDADLQAKEAYKAVIDPETYIANYTPDEDEETARQGIASFGTPTIDGEIDSVWEGVQELPIDQYQMAWQGANGVAKTLWDNENLYVLVQVDNNSELDKTSANAYEHDSVEIFVDQNNAKSTSYEEDDGQYRVNFDNEASFSSDKIKEGFESETKLDGTNYLVEVKIPLSSISPETGNVIGFDVQINDAKDGARESTAIWNDLSGNGFQDTSVFGELTLGANETEQPEDPETPETPNPENPEDPETPGTPNPENPEQPETPGTPNPENPEQPESPGKSDPNKPAPSDKDNVVVEPTDKDSNDDKSGSKGNTLPNTATNTFNFLIIGAIMLIAGASFIAINRRRNA